MSVAIAKVFGSAMAGTSKARPELVDALMQLAVRIEVLPCRGGEPLLRRLFEPLGYKVGAEDHELDTNYPDWGSSRYFSVTLEGTLRVRDLLAHLYVLIPVLDDAKHYWVAEDEIEKLLRRGSDWLRTHPERDLIVDRYLKHRRSLARQAVARLVEQEQPGADEVELEQEQEEEAVEKPLGLNQQRVNAVLAVLRNTGARRVLDLGCGGGKLLTELFSDKSFSEIVGVDVSYRSLDLARQRLRLDRLPERQAARVKLLHGSLTYRDKRIAGYDAAALVEVIEHLDAFRLPALERVVFEHARPGVVVVTTPNIEYNVRFETLPAGQLRHRDHRFEWTREQFRGWANAVSQRHGYQVRFMPVGPDEPDVGPPTQMAVFSS
jgi:3' terminal RNA ribose 2'-O-methyltransferase Hen1